MTRLKLILAALLVAFICAPAFSGAEEPVPVVKGIKVIKYGEDLGVEISADRDLAYTCSKMPQLLRVVIDLPGTDPGQPDTVYKVQSALISTIRLQKKMINDVMVTRISVNLAEDADFTERIDPVNKKKLTVVLHRSAPPLSAASAAVSAAAAPKLGGAKQQSPQQKHSSAQVGPVPKPAVKPAEPVPAQSVTVSEVSFSADAIDIRTGGAVSDFKVFTLSDPGRLVIDLPAARSSINSIAVPANRFGIVASRIGSSAGKLRLVFVAGEKPFPGYRVEKTGTGLRVMGIFMAADGRDK
jgi:type IV pilus assembly protein PilQ